MFYFSGKIFKAKMKFCNACADTVNEKETEKATTNTKTLNI